MVSIVRTKRTIAVQIRLAFGLPIAVERNRARHWRPRVTAAPYARLDKNIPVKYVFSFSRTAGGRSGVQLGSYSMMAADLAELDRNAAYICWRGRNSKEGDGDIEKFGPVSTENK
jgi:hypothetical protein